MTEPKNESGSLPTQDEAAKKAPDVARVKLTEQGPFLPIPTPEGKRLEIGHFTRWNLRKEKELGELRKQNSELNLGEWISMLLGEMCSTIGPHDLRKMSQPERQLFVSQLSMPDVLYVYFWLRYCSLGPELRINMECPFHDYKFWWTGDLRTLIVRVPHDFESACWDFEAKDGVELRGKEVRRFRCGPPVWGDIEAAGLGRRINAGKLKAAMIRASVREIEGEAIALSDEELDEMTKRDVERMIYLVDENSMGPDLKLEARCDSPKCERDFVTSLDWSYESFFSTSSP